MIIVAAIACIGALSLIASLVEAAQERSGPEYEEDYSWYYDSED